MIDFMLIDRNLCKIILNQVDESNHFAKPETFQYFIKSLKRINSTVNGFEFYSANLSSVVLEKSQPNILAVASLVLANLKMF